MGMKERAHTTGNYAQYAACMKSILSGYWREEDEQGTAA